MGGRFRVVLDSFNEMGNYVINSIRYVSLFTLRFVVFSKRSDELTIALIFLV